MRYTPLPQRGLLTISGEDAGAFLQGLISNDIKKLAEGRPLYAALLSPQGKYLYDFFLIQTPEAILLDGEKERLPQLLQLLTLYKLRSKVTLSSKEGAVTAAWGDAISPIGLPDPRLPALGFRLYGEDAPTTWEKATPEAYDAMRLNLGVPDGSRDFLIDKTFLLEAHFEALHGVDFNKGCYVGQEVTARSKFRGQVRKSFYRVESAAALPAPGPPVMLGAEAAGEMRSSAGSIGLAVLRTDAVAQGADLTAAGQKITAISPAWAAA
jgi:folate-binding protein YgfZ